MAEQAVADSRVLQTLDEFSPVVVSTIWVGFDIEGSDIDIVGSCSDFQEFESVFSQAYSGCAEYECSRRTTYALGRFRWDDFLIEAFLSSTPVQDQPAYRHFRVMQRLATLAGENFGERVRALKKGGMKTEPALCALLGLSGDPYVAVLDLESWSDSDIQRRILETLERGRAG